MITDSVRMRSPFRLGLGLVPILLVCLLSRTSAASPHKHAQSERAPTCANLDALAQWTDTGRIGPKLGIEQKTWEPLLEQCAASLDERTVIEQFRVSTDRNVRNAASAILAFRTIDPKSVWVADYLERCNDATGRDPAGAETDLQAVVKVFPPERALAILDAILDPATGATCRCQANAIRLVASGGQPINPSSMSALLNGSSSCQALRDDEKRQLIFRALLLSNDGEAAAVVKREFKRLPLDADFVRALDTLAKNEDVVKRNTPFFNEILAWKSHLSELPPIGILGIELHQVGKLASIGGGTCNELIVDKGGPAWTAGVQAMHHTRDAGFTGPCLIAVNGTDVSKARTDADILPLLRGPPGATVTLTQRAFMGQQQQTYSVTRADGTALLARLRAYELGRIFGPYADVASLAQFVGDEIDMGVTLPPAWALARLMDSPTPDAVREISRVFVIREPRTSYGPSFPWRTPPRTMTAEEQTNRSSPAGRDRAVWAAVRSPDDQPAYESDWKTLYGDQQRGYIETLSAVSSWSTLRGSDAEQFWIDGLAHPTSFLKGVIGEENRDSWRPWCRSPTDFCPTDEQWALLARTRLLQSVALYLGKVGGKDAIAALAAFLHYAADVSATSDTHDRRAGSLSGRLITPGVAAEALGLAQDAAALSALRDYVLSTHDETVRSIMGKYYPGGKVRQSIALTCNGPDCAAVMRAVKAALDKAAISADDVPQAGISCSIASSQKERPGSRNAGRSVTRTLTVECSRNGSRTKLGAFEDHWNVMPGIEMVTGFKGHAQESTAQKITEFVGQ